MRFWTQRGHGVVPVGSFDTSSSLRRSSMKWTSQGLHTAGRPVGTALAE